MFLVSKRFCLRIPTVVKVLEMKFLFINVVRTLPLCLVVLVLASCRVILTNDGGGSIVSLSGAHNCSSASCEFTLSDSLNDTFTAVPEDGYRFSGWLHLERDT